MQTNKWRIFLIDEGVSYIIPAYRDGAMMPDLGATPIIEDFSNNIDECETTCQLIQFYHATMGYPCTSTLCKAITAGYFKGWPGLTAARVRRFIKVVEETEMGHMNQQHQCTQSTKPIPINPNTMEELPQLPNNDRNHHVYMTITDLDGKLYSNQTGRFPITSNRSNCYVVIFYAVDGNYIKAYPIKSYHRSQLLKAYDDVYAFLIVRGHQTQLQNMGNETSKDVENFIEEQQAKVQYTPSEIQHANIAERSCRTWRNNFTAVRADAPPYFRMANWCKITEQCNITLNMM